MPWFEGPDGVDRVNKLMRESLAPLWRVGYTRMPPGSPYNFTCWPEENIRQRVVLDITERTNPMSQLDRWGGVFYQETQWLAAQRKIKDNPGQVFVFAPLCLGQHWAMATTTFEHDGRERARPEGRSDRNSTDWCVKLKMVRFDIVNVRRPWERPTQATLL